MTGPTDKTTKNFSIRLNSEGLCFICLRDTKANAGDHAPPTSFRLRNIARFLGIDTKSILKAYLDHDFKRCWDVKVELCEGCSEQVHKFNCLYQTLELTKLKLNECARKISSLIKVAEEDCDDDRTGEIERRVTHSGTKGVIVDFRARISKKCLEVSEAVLPRVMIKRLRESELTSVLCRNIAATGFHTTTPIKIEVSDEDDDSGSFIDIDDTSAFHVSGYSDEGSVIAQEETQTESGLKSLSKSCRLDGNFPCSFCKAVFVRKRNLQYHLVKYHLQAHFFPEEEYKEPSLSSQRFTQIVTFHLFKNVFTTHPVTESVSRCPHCSKTFGRERATTFKLHIMNAHKSPLVQRLKQLQKDPILLEKLLKKTKKWVCKCGVQVATGQLYNAHQQKLCRLPGNTTANATVATNKLYNTHQKKFCRLLGDPTVGKEFLAISHQKVKSSISQAPDGTLQTSCPHCRAVFANKRLGHLKRFLENHLTAFHLNTFFPEEDFKEPSLSFYSFQQVIHHHLFANIHSDPGNPNLSKCPNCSVTMTKDKLSQLKMHVIKFHYEYLVQRLQELQKNSTILSRLSKISKEYVCNCGAYFSKVMPYHMHRSKYCNLIKTTPTNAGPELPKQYSEIVNQQINSSISKSEVGILQKSCSHCRAVFRSRTLCDLRVLTWDHLVRGHLHTFFPEDKHKDPCLSAVQFKQVIHHLLFENVKTDPNVKTKRNHYKCPHCKVTVLKKHITRLKMHLIKSHYQSLVHRLEELQKDAQIFEKLGKIRKALICECGTHFEFRKSFELHRQKFCNLNSVLVEASASSGIDSSTCSTKRDPLASEDEDNNDHLSDSEDMFSIDIGDVKPNISIKVKHEEDIGAPERKRRGSELDSDSSSSETNLGIPQKIVKLDL